MSPEVARRDTAVRATAGSTCSCVCRARWAATGDGTNPEQLFAVGYAACFEGALGVVARRAKIDVDDVAIESRVTLSPTGDGGFQLGVELDVGLEGLDRGRRARAELVARRASGVPLLQRDPRQHRGRAHGQRTARLAAM